MAARALRPMRGGSHRIGTASCTGFRSAWPKRTASGWSEMVSQSRTIDDQEPTASRSNVYEEIATGLRGYWYPVTWSRRVRRQPVVVRVLDKNIVLIRDQGEVSALLDRCPHRGIPLS